ncbi:serine threonine- phosphatase 5 [Chlorella sorokiniana]|uniref:Serine threonine-phosphatase 5 n=1 Tax=Chlorella sorokiniana TaxID=3076 RepID=A0A2P6TT52_CHLSO|nr:serine threonine- phosphatase 5 [Chlorella sorokiniana]|eukprot:PRW57250.1 serine threonine- phosphatase 5 [Chlorella sorokiniana]
MAASSSDAGAPAGSGGGEPAAPGGAAPAAAAAESFKEQGNALYKEGHYLKAAAAYTQGLKADPSHSVLYSNRSAALLQLSKTGKALADAEECIRLRPDWDKGYFRKAAALEALGRMEEALQCYRSSLERNKESKQLAEKVRVLTKIVDKSKRSNGSGSAAGS